MLRILQVGLGPLGIRVVEDLYDRRLGRVVAAVDQDPQLIGRSLSKIIEVEAGHSDQVPSCVLCQPP